MKLSQLIAESQHILDTIGDMDVYFQPTPVTGEQIAAEEVVFVVPELYGIPSTEIGVKPSDEWSCNLRAWPY